MRHDTPGREAGTLPSRGVDDIKAVLRRYGISRFTYHIWTPGTHGSLRNEGDGKMTETGGSVLDFFTDRGGERTGDTPSGEAAHHGPGPQDVSPGDSLDPGNRWAAAICAREETTDSRVAPGVTGVPWDPPEDLDGARLPIFDSMHVPPELAGGLRLDEQRPTISELGPDEEVPPELAACAREEEGESAEELDGRLSDATRWEAPLAGVARSSRGPGPERQAPGTSVLAYFSRGAQDE